jgi:hypothetical protein
MNLPAVPANQLGHRRHLERGRRRRGRTQLKTPGPNAGPPARHMDYSRYLIDERCNRHTSQEDL